MPPDMQMTEAAKTDASVILDVADLAVAYRVKNKDVTILDGLNLQLRRGEMLGIVGESGSGKSTLAYAMLNMLPKPGRIVRGSIHFGEYGDMARMSENQRAKLWGNRIAMVFQAAQSVFNPLQNLRRQFLDILQAHHADTRAGIERARLLMRQAQLNADRVLKSYPHELSGGMKQRVSIVASMLLKPDLLLMDEPTSALDVVSQATILRLLKELREQTNVTIVFITHDFAVVSSNADRIAVMYAGRIVEIGTTRQVYHAPRHPYTKALIKAVPNLKGALTDLQGIPGQPPDPQNLPPGCPFAPRCEFATDVCRERDVKLEQVAEETYVACFHHEKVAGSVMDNG